jgi:hypothetical protein
MYNSQQKPANKGRAVKEKMEGKGEGERGFCSTKGIWVPANHRAEFRVVETSQPLLCHFGQCFHHCRGRAIMWQLDRCKAQRTSQLMVSPYLLQVLLLSRFAG